MGQLSLNTTESSLAHPESGISGQLPAPYALPAAEMDIRLQVHMIGYSG